MLPKKISRHLKILKSQYLSEFLRYVPDIFYVITTFIGFKKTFSNMGYGIPTFISRGWSNCLIPTPHLAQNLKGLP